MQEKIIDTAKVWGAILLANLTWANVNGALTCFSILLASSYTVWKWRRDKNKS